MDFLLGLGKINVTATPILYQNLSSLLFKQYIKTHCDNRRSHAASTPAITQNEKNALKYAAGYICKKKIE